MNRILLAHVFCILLLLPSSAEADSFGSGANRFEIEFVTIGDPGNPADTSGDPNPAGAVAYEYRIGKYEISEQMINKANAQSAAEGNSLGITIDARGPNKPATRASWFEAARLVNWLNTSTGNTPAYKFDDQGEFQLWEPSDSGYDPKNYFRNSQAKYFLPSADEWYKAAYYDPATDEWFDFPNGMNTPPRPVASGTDPNTAVYDQLFDRGPADVMFAGGESPFGTIAQAGNVHEFQESSTNLAGVVPQSLRAFRGGHWVSVINPTGLSSSVIAELLPSLSVGDIGFRVARVVPEPTGMSLAMLATTTLVLRRK